MGPAVITPRRMEYVLSEETAPRFAQFGRNVLGVKAEDDMEAARQMIAARRHSRC